MPGSTQKTVTPLRVSPLMICQGMALPPRYPGSSDGWKQMLPSRGTSNTLCGTICVTYASTPRSARSASNSPCTSGFFSDACWRTGMFERQGARLDGIRLAAGRIGRAVDRHHLVAVVAQAVENLFRERRLADRE